MSECSISLNFKAPNSVWARALGTQKDPVDRLPALWWQAFKDIGGELYQDLLNTTDDREFIGIESWYKSGNSIEMKLVEGYNGDDLIQALVLLLHDVGCLNIEAIIYEDGCEYVTDDDGVDHPMGTRYFINQSGQLDDVDYPEIEYEYY